MRVRGSQRELPDAAWSRMLSRDASTRPCSPFPFASSGSGSFGLAQHDRVRTAYTTLFASLGHTLLPVVVGHGMGVLILPGPSLSPSGHTLAGEKYFSKNMSRKVEKL